MRKIAIVDARRDYIADIQTRIMLNDAEFDLVGAANSADEITKLINRTHPDEVIIAENILKTQEDWDYSAPVATYVQTAEGLQLSTQYGLKTYGIFKSNMTEALVTAIECERYKVIEGVKEEKKVQSVKNEQKVELKEEKREIGKEVKGLPILEESGHDYNDIYHKSEVNKPVYENKEESAKSTGGFTIGEEEPARYAQNKKTTIEKENYKKEDVQNHSSQNDYYRLHKTPMDIDKEMQAERMAATGGGNTAEIENKSQGNRTFNRSNSSYHNKEVGNKTLAERMMEEDIRRKEHGRETKVVSFYAAKGGVGKTTLSTEIAVYLSLMKNENRSMNNRVCIVDYNVDFGDVLTTLYLDANGVNMLYWADDIEDKIKAGMDDSEIRYSRAQIEGYLQVMKNCGLYALVAPINHEDSMSLTERVLTIMIKNLIAFGDFDYIICDTGNNTRDSTIIALDHSDIVYLVVTQDVTTANCNSSFLQAINQVGFNLDKIRLIINDIMPFKETGISVKELEEYFPNYPCVGRVRHNTDVIVANNSGKPLTLNPTHEYTKDMKSIIHNITGVMAETETPAKTGFFIKLFKKK